MMQLAAEEEALLGSAHGGEGGYKPQMRPPDKAASSAGAPPKGPPKSPPTCTHTAGGLAEPCPYPKAAISHSEQMPEATGPATVLLPLPSFYQPQGGGNQPQACAEHTASFSHGGTDLSGICCICKEQKAGSDCDTCGKPVCMHCNSYFSDDGEHCCDRCFASLLIDFDEVASFYAYAERQLNLNKGILGELTRQGQCRQARPTCKQCGQPFGDPYKVWGPTKNCKVCLKRCRRSG